VGLPGGTSLGLGLRSVALAVPPGAASGICAFYQVALGASATLEKGQEGELGGRQVCRVAIGFHQELRFEETTDPIPEYDGHHIAVYVNRFEDLYKRLHHKGLVWNNPRFPQFQYDTLEDALRHREFRFKDLVHPETGKHLYTLEHEVRSLNHPGFSCPTLLPSTVEQNSQQLAGDEGGKAAGRDLLGVAAGEVGRGGQTRKAATTLKQASVMEGEL